MSRPGIRVGSPTTEQLDSILEQARRSTLSYDHQGSTLDDRVARSGRVHEQVRTLGHGRGCFDAGVAALRGWACHAGSTQVHPPSTPIEVGATLLVALRAGPVSIVVPNRIVAVVDEPRRFGFAYGTLDGHQERGEEAFLVELLDDDTVRAVVRVDASPASLAARLGGPAVGALQRLAIRHYLRSLAAAVGLAG